MHFISLSTISEESLIYRVHGLVMVCVWYDLLTVNSVFGRDALYDVKPHRVGALQTLSQSDAYRFAVAMPVVGHWWRTD
jgi:hypothetical protein